MNYLMSGVSSVGNLFIETCDNLLPELAYNAVSAGFQDERIGAIIGGIFMTAAGINVIQASRESASSQSDQQPERVFKKAFRLGGVALGVAGSCIGLSMIALGTLCLLFPDDSISQPVEYIYEESDQSNPMSNLDPDLNLHTDCIYPDSLPGCKPECTHSSSQIKNNYPCIPGLHSSLSPITGARAHELEKFRGYPDEDFRSALEEMTSAMYRFSSESRQILHKKDLKQATILANEMYSRYLDRYRPFGINEKNAVLRLGREGCSKNGIKQSHARIVGTSDDKTWGQQVVLCDAVELKNEFVMPAGVVAMHELRHAEERKAGSTEKGSELFTVLGDMINLHRIRSQIYGLDPDVEVDYGKTITVFPRQRTGCGRFDQVPLGKFVAFYSKLARSKQGDLAETVFSPESIEFLSSCETEKKSLQNRLS